MWQLLFLAALFSTATAQSDGNGGWFCNYTARGDEVVEEAVPIHGFATSGANSTRPQWCMAYCADKASIRATMLFQPSNPRPPRYNRATFKDYKGDFHHEVSLVNGGQLFGNFTPPSDDNCIDPNVYKAVDEVFKQNKGASVDVLAQQLAVTINKPGWAYLVYELAPDSSWLISTANVFIDVNFCMKTKSQDIDKDTIYHQVFAGLIHS